MQVNANNKKNVKEGMNDMKKVKKREDDVKDDMKDMKKLEKIEDDKENIVYPTAWHAGIPTGFISDQTNFYRVVAPDKKLRAFYWNEPMSKRKDDNYEILESKEMAFKRATEYLLEASDRLGKTKNKWRYVDENSIEIKVEGDRTFFMDKTMHHLIEKKPCYAKKVHSKHHIMTKKEENSRLCINLAKLIMPNLKIVEFIDGNPLNLRKSNLRELGEIKITNEMKELENNDKTYDFKIDHYELFKCVDMPWVLPKNKWILGKPAGTLFAENGYWFVRFQNGDNYASKTFKYNDNNKDDVFKIAQKWQYNISYRRNQTKNLIKILDDKHILVQITKDNNMITNIEFISLLQQIPLFTTTCGSGNGDPYCATSVNRKNIMFYNLITQNKMTDHLNGNTLDNTLENLIPCTHSTNNFNRHNNSDIDNLNLKQDKHGLKYVQMNNKIDGVMFSKNIYSANIEQLDGDEHKLLKQIASLYKKFLVYGTWNNLLERHIDRTDAFATIHFRRIVDCIQNEIVTFENYFNTFTKQGLTFTPLEKSIIYNSYYGHQNKHIIRYANAYEKIINKL
jgi:hypothetical protein